MKILNPNEDKKMREELSELEKKLPYADFYDRPSAEIPSSVLHSIQNESHDNDDALLIEDINELLNPGYLAMENGHCRMPNGSFFVAVRTEFKDVTAEMINWWFDWHPREPLRYKIWFPECHYDISFDAGERKSPDDPLFWNTTHYPVEDIGLGSEKISIHFLPPADFGFNTAEFDKASIETVICGNVGSVANSIKQIVRMCHLVRKTDDGLEMRSRFWMGDNILLPQFFGSSLIEKVINTKIVRKRLLPSQTGEKMAMHCAQEYNNLAKILPELYQSYH